MRISEIFIGKPSDSFFRRYRFTLISVAYITFVVNVWPDGSGPQFFIALGGLLTFLVPIVFMYAVATRHLYKLLCSKYPDHDFASYSPKELFALKKELKVNTIWGDMAESYSKGRNEAHQSIAGRKIVAGISNRDSDISSGSGKSTAATGSSLHPECIQGGTITKWDGKNLEYQIRCTHCGDDQRPKNSSGGYQYNSPQPIRVIVNSEHDLNITYGYVCNICGRQSETRIRNGNG